MNPVPATFLERATPYARLGIPVFPLLARMKVPPASMTDWPGQATTNLSRVNTWNEDNSNYNCGLVALLGGFLFLEFDIRNGMKAAAEEMGQLIPVTRVHTSGGGFSHFIFRATPYSDRLGNRQANVPDGGEWFSFRADRRYVVGPGSVHPNGNLYKVARDMDPIEVPDWICDWVAKHTRSNAAPREAITVSSDFDFQEFIDHYGIEASSSKGDYWQITKVCPIAGRRHSGSVLTGFYYDGSSLGFKCFAGRCPGSGMSIGMVIRHLNESQEPYMGPIWEPYDDGLDDFAEPAVDDEDEVEPLGVEDLVKFSGAIVGDVPDEPPTKPSHANHDYVEEFMAELAPTDSLPVPDSVATSVVPVSGLAFDPRSLYGKLGEISRRLESGGIPLGYGYPSVLTVASALDDVEDEAHNVRSNIYTALLGDVGWGKSAAVKAAVASIFLPEGTADRVTPSSDRGLANQCGDQGSRKLLIQDEYRATLQKCGMQGSALPQLFNALWNDDRAGAADKKGVEICFARLSLLGNLTCADPTEFAKMFGASSVSGLVDRHLFGWHDSSFKYRPIAGLHAEILHPKPVKVPNWIWDAKDKWLDEGDPRERSRLSEHALRVALIQSSCNGDSEITQASFEASLRYAEWQERLRQTYRPGLGESNDAVCFEAIYKALWETYERQVDTRKPPKGANTVTDDLGEQCKLLHFATIMNLKSYYRRFGPTLLNRTKANMVNENIILEVLTDPEEDDNGRKKKGKKTTFVKLKRKIQ
jgi:hypothetical protein